MKYNQAFSQIYQAQNCQEVAIFSQSYNSISQIKKNTQHWACLSLFVGPFTILIVSGLTANVKTSEICTNIANIGLTGSCYSISQSLLSPSWESPPPPSSSSLPEKYQSDGNRPPQSIWSDCRNSDWLWCLQAASQISAGQAGGYKRKSESDHLQHTASHHHRSELRKRLVITVCTVHRMVTLRDQMLAKASKPPFDWDST